MGYELLCFVCFEMPRYRRHGYALGAEYKESS